MLVENQMIQMEWNYKNKKWYESKGYHFTKYGDSFTVNVEDLIPGSNKKIEVICDYCQTPYETKYVTYYKGINIYPKSACSKCAGKKTKDISIERRRKEYFDKINKICKINNYILITDMLEYTNSNMWIEYMCPYHGYKKSRARHFIQGHICDECGIENMKQSRSYNKDYIEQYINDYNGNKLLNKDEYINCITNNLKIQCGICGENIFITSFDVYKRSMKMCSCCSFKKTKNERIIDEILSKYKIKFEDQKRFDDCRDIKPLPFDFYLQDYNLCIEYDGKQHYEPIEYFGGEEEFKVRKRHDEIKTQYCKDNNINLLRIPYWEKDNIENIILDYLKLYGY